MNWHKITRLFIFGVIIAIAIYDVVTISQGGVETSISNTIIVWSYKYPIFTFVMGIVMGHLFWRLKDNPETKDLGK
jgi:hypothetical protein